MNYPYPRFLVAVIDELPLNLEFILHHRRHHRLLLPQLA
jgi:hypothetical protein